MDEQATGQPIRFEHYRVSTDEQGRPLKLGEGAMGVTYLAEDTNLKVRVALKVIRPQLLGDAEVGQRFQREAQAAARLRHPNVAGVYHLGMVDNTFFYAMEFVEGETVKDRVQRNGPMPLKEALEVALQVCEALGAAEKHKMVHRDIKPANIMLEAIEDDLLRVKLIDFGLAKPLHAEAQNSMALQTQAGIFLGTPVFASPEQIQDVPPDSRSDFYSLGLTLWFMLEGRTPFEGSLHKVLFDQVHTAPPLGRLLWIPAEVRDLLGKLLEKDPANRPQTARELRQKIHDCLRALATSGTSYTEWQQRFQVEGSPRSKPWGMIYEGQDTLSGAVRLHLLRHDRFSDPKAVQGVIADARRAIDIHHPNILRHLTVFPTSGGQGAGWMVVTEHPGNQTLLDHLRKVKQLPPAEAIAIVQRLASAIDTCIANDLITADLDPAGIFLKQVPRTEIHALTQTASATATATPSPSSSSVTTLTTDTFEVVPKLSPINYSFLTTLRPADETAIGLTQGAFRAEATTPQELVQRLALLAYQCLGGAVPSTWSRVPRFIPLASLSQRQNDTLRSALVDSTWVRAMDFVEAFQQPRPATRRQDETARITTSAEATVMLSSWRMLADLASADSGEFSTEHAKEFTGKIEKHPEPAPEPATEETGNAGAEETPPDLQPAEKTIDLQEDEASAIAPAEGGVQAASAMLESTSGIEQTQTWSRFEEPAEMSADETARQETSASFKEQAQELEESTSTAQEKSPNETETIVHPSRTAQLLVTAVPPEITEDTTVTGQTTTTNEAGAPVDEASAQPEISESSTLTDGSLKSSAKVDEQAEATTAASCISDASPEKLEAPSSPVSGSGDTAENNTNALAPKAVTGTSSFIQSESVSPPPPAAVPMAEAPATTSTSGMPLPPPVRALGPSTPKAKVPDSKRPALPRWMLPAAAALVVTLLIAGMASWMSDDGDHPTDPENPPVVVNPPQPQPPPTPPPPTGPTLAELLTTAGNSAIAGNLATLDKTLEEIREQFPNQSWETDPAANAFRDKLFRAYREKKLGDGAKAARKYHDILLAATLARESDIPLLKQICADLSSADDAARAESFEKALLNSLAADSSRKEQRLKEALAMVQRRPGSSVAKVACGILSKELKETVDFLEQVPRDESQEEYLKNALPTLLPHLKEIAEAGVPEAYYILGDQAYRENRRAEAERHFERATDLEHVPSMRRYGNALTNEVGNRRVDMKAARYHLEQASDQGDLKAKILLADIYLPQSPTATFPWKGKEAEELLNEAMKGGIAEAEYLYGAMLMDFKPNHPSQPFAPQLTGKNRWDKTVEHLRKAVARDVSRAYPALAKALVTNPHGKDIAAAKEVLEKGVRLNPPNPFCMLYLSGLISGNHANEEFFTAEEVASAGVLANPVRADQLRTEAIRLLRAAAANDEADAIQWCKTNGIPY